jgi:hypothetical protein
MTPRPIKCLKEQTVHTFSILQSTMAPNRQLQWLCIGAFWATSISALSCRETIETLPSVINDVAFVLHRNGEPKDCGIVASSIETMVKNAPDCDAFDPYIVESFLTEYFLDQLDNGSCNSPDDASAKPDLSGFCDMGPDRTVIQRDHRSLVPLSTNSLPCRWFTREGLRVSTLEVLVGLADTAVEQRNTGDCRDNDADEQCFARATVHLYGVPAGRVFMFAPSFVGEKFVINHVQDADGKTLTMEVLSVNPRIFDIANFFNKEESDDLVEKALAETDEVFGFHRSTTGTSSIGVFSKRTSENAWDTSGPSAMAVKK